MVSAMNIVATGARTPLGTKAGPSAAAVRAGIIAAEELPYFRDKLSNPIPAALDSGVEFGVMGPARLVQMARSALEEACLPLNNTVHAGRQIPVFLGLSEFRPGFSAQDSAAVLKGIREMEGLPVKIAEVSGFPQGHAAGFLALSAAIEKLQQGAFDMCLVGGVDSYYNPDTLEWLDANRQLAGADSRSSFVPGEGAGFCLLATDKVCAKLSEAPQARLHTVQTGQETKRIKTDEVCLGEGLSKTVEGAVATLPRGDRINQVICDVNGERYRGEEWGFVCLRLSHYFDDPTGYLSPADCWGDIGAASVPLFAMLACQAAQRGYGKGPRTLLWASSEGGLRGAAVLEARGKV